MATATRTAIKSTLTIAAHEVPDEYSSTGSASLESGAVSTGSIGYIMCLLFGGPLGFAATYPRATSAKPRPFTIAQSAWNFGLEVLTGW
jgi:hypothetical protein